jgi:ketosteroid isomerase-like protein
VRILVTLALALAMFAPGNPASAQTAPVPAGVLAASNARDAAYIAGDATALAPYLADDFLETDEFGVVRTKSTWLNSFFAPIAQLIHSGQYKLVTYQRSGLQARTFGNVVVVIGALQQRSSLQSVASSDSPAVNYRFTEVWVQGSAGWKLAIAQKDRPTNNK